MSKFYNIRWTLKYGRDPMLLVLKDDGIYEAKFPFHPYFYIKTKDLEKAAQISPLGIDQHKLPDGFTKIETYLPSDVPKQRGALEALGIETFEADIPYHRRVMLDENIQMDIPDKYLIYDFEVDPRGGFPTPEKAEKRIISIAAKDNKGKEWIFCEDDEISMITDFLNIAKKYHVIGGWNSLRFDFPYLKNRTRNLGISEDFFNLIDIDLLAAYKFITLAEKESFRLEDIAVAEDVREVEDTVDYEMEQRVEDLYEDFLHNREALTTYNINDARMALGIEKKYEIIRTIATIARETYTLIGDMFYLDFHDIPRVSVMTPVETINNKIANEMGIYLPTKREYPKAGIRGGEVLEPDRGVLSNIMFLDFKSFYPNIIRTWNMGIETWLEKEEGSCYKAPIGYFKKSPKSFTSEAVDRLMHIKEDVATRMNELSPGSYEYKALGWKYHSTKVVLNSLYGVMGFHKSKLYKKEVAENITSIARELLRVGSKKATELGYKIVGGDTDSIFVKVPDFTTGAELAKIIGEEVRKYAEAKYLVNPKYLHLEPDRFFYRIIIMGKKKYAGLVTWKGHPTFHIYKRGLESVRHDWPAAVKEFQNKLLESIVTGQKWINYVEDTKRKLFLGELDHKLTTFKSMKKPPHEYAPKPPHVRAALMLISKGEQIRPGDKIGFIKVGERKNSIIPVWQKKHPPLNRKHYAYLWKKKFKPIMDRFGIEESVQTNLDEVTKWK